MDFLCLLLTPTTGIGWALATRMTTRTGQGAEAALAHPTAWLPWTSTTASPKVRSPCRSKYQGDKCPGEPSACRTYCGTRCQKVDNAADGRQIPQKLTPQQALARTHHLYDRTVSTQRGGSTRKVTTFVNDKNTLWRGVDVVGVAGVSHFHRRIRRRAPVWC